eukprot:symbB.v1.2.033349.t1/scaffold4132.1/size44191/2
MECTSDGNGNNFAPVLEKLEKMENYLALRLDEQDKALRDVVDELQRVQENQRVSTITGANFTVPERMTPFHGADSTTTMELIQRLSQGRWRPTSETGQSDLICREPEENTEEHHSEEADKSTGETNLDSEVRVAQVRASRRVEKMRRGSSRVSFVRTQMLGQHVKAQEAASRLTFVRTGVRYSMSQQPLNRRQRLALFLSTNAFNNFIMGLIVGNAIMLGVEIDVSSRMGQNEIPAYFGVLNTALVFIFVAETILKMVAVGCHQFWRGDEALWNIFDFVIVSISVAETVVDYAAQSLSATADGSGSFRVMRALRLARTLRGVRIIRLFRYFSALRGLILSIFSTLGSLLWTLLLLLIVFYVFSCIFAQLVTDHCRFQTIDSTGNANAIPECPKNLEYWSNVMDSMMTLFMAITGGINWEDSYIGLKDVGLVAMGMMNLYIVIGFFTILNVVTGVFVNTAIESASADKDIATLKQMHKRVAQMESLQQIFNEIDDSNANQVSIDELEEALTTNKLGSFMESLGISTDDVWGLFLLIDADENGVIDLDEFVSGCMQLHGPAKSLQVAKMSYENKITRQAIKHVTDDLQEVKRLLTATLKFRLVKEAV